MEYNLRQASVDDEPCWRLVCPGCGGFGSLDDDQFHGRVSVQCDCGFHETVNFAELVEKEKADADAAEPS